MSVLRKIRTLSGLPAGEVTAFLEATALLAYARLLVNLVPLSRWRDQITVAPNNEKEIPELAKVQRQKARMVMRSIERVSRNLPVEFVCLPQALSARWMLSRRGIPTELFLGTRLAAEDEREFHAWLKAGDIMITGHCDEAAYAVFGSQMRA